MVLARADASVQPLARLVYFTIGGASVSWPGAPKSASSPPINPPSQRFPNTLDEKSTMGDVANAMRRAFDGLTVHEQAFANLPNQISTQAAAAAQSVVENISSENVTNVVTAFNAKAGPILFFPGLGLVNNQIGETSYETQQSDSGKVILLADSSPVELSLNAGVQIPWFCLVSNTDSGPVTLAPTSGLINGDSSLALPGYSWGITFFDAVNFWILGVAS